MGVINANDDSFFEGSRFKGRRAVKEIETMIDNGANIIDIGGVSSRPGSEAVSEEEELKRVKPVIDEVYASKLYEKALFSLDSYSPKCLEYALDRGFKIVNDITALSNDEVSKVASKYNAKVVLMHMKGTPKDMQKNPFYEDVIEEVESFFKERIKKALDFGIEDIILDVGIGFGKRLKDNLLLIKHLSHFKKFGYELLIGASRKSMIDKISPSPVDQRLPGTLVLHQMALQNGASILRVHDVKEHKQALLVYEALKNTLV
jgi:dihydropteroate synthase